MNIHADIPSPPDAFSRRAFARLSFAVIMSVFVFLAQGGLIHAEEEETTETNVVINCEDDGSACVVTFESGGYVDVRFKNSQDSCQAAYESLKGAIVFEGDVQANYSSNCGDDDDVSASGIAGSGNGVSGSQSSSGQAGQTAAPPEHNCCLVDRECTTSDDWVDGYYAYQNGQCAAASQSQTQTSTTDSTAASSQNNNCCGIDRQCTTDEQWTDGYYAYQNGQCSAQS